MYFLFRIYVRILYSTAGGQWWHSTIIFLLRMSTTMMILLMMMMRISFIHSYIYILNIYRWHAHISHVPFFLLKWFKWVITVGIWTYVWNFVHYSADFLYAWLHSRLIVSIHIYFFVLFLLKQNSLEYPALLKESESFVCININKNKNRWILVDRYISIDIYLAICILFVIILSSKERSFCLFYLLKSIISFIISPVAYFYHKDYKGKKVTQTRSLVHIFKSMM